MNGLTQWIINNGVSRDMLLILVFIPIIASVINIGRYFVGMKSFGIYAPIVLAIAYTYTGLRYGIVLTTLVAISSILGYNILKRVRMHYISRVAVNYIIIILSSILGILVLSNLPLGFEKFNMINPLAIISIVALSDFFTKMYIKKNIVSTVRVLIETVIMSIIGWYLISSEALINVLINNLWLIIIIALINVLIGFYPGLRIKELIRFWSVIQNDNQDIKKN